MARQTKPLTDFLPVSEKLVQRRIYSIRGKQIMLARDLAELYRVPTFRLNEAVKRNQNRFPADFMFRLTKEESKSLTSHFAMLKRGKHSKYLPYAFTDYGVAMLSAVLNSQKAVQMSIIIMRAFINLRVMLEEYKILSKEVIKLKGVQDLHSQVLAKVVKKLENISSIKPNLIGFRIK